MEFKFTDDQLAITNAARTFLVEHCTAEDLRRLVAENRGREPGRMAALRELGVYSMLAPVEDGGLGLVPADFAGLAEAAGYVALPEPLIEHAGIAIPFLNRLGDDRGWIKRASEGALIAIACPQSAHVLDADIADALVLPHDDEVHLVERAAVTLTPAVSVDGQRRLFKVNWAPKPTTRIGSGWTFAQDLGATWTAGQLIGLGQRAIDLAVDYAKQRTQFGKPIGSYQAIKHHLATAQTAIEFARPVFYAAAAEAGLGLAASARASHAKIAASEAADVSTRTALQVHGAIGMTSEASLHFYFKRALALRYSWGSATMHQKRIQERLASLPTGPEYSFASELVELSGATYA